MSLKVGPEHLIDLLVEDDDLGHLYFDIIQHVDVLNREGVDPRCNAILCLHDRRPD